MGGIYPRCRDVYQKLNTSTKAVYVTKLSDALIMQLNIFKYIGGIRKKVSTNWSIDEEILFWGKWMLLSGFICHEWEQAHS